EGIRRVKRRKHAFGDRRARHAMESVAPRYHVTFEDVRSLRVAIPDARGVGVDPLEGDVIDFEVQRLSGRDRRGDQVLDDLMLTVDRDRPAAREPSHVDSMISLLESEE